MNIVFMGTPNIAKECLQGIVEKTEHNIIAVFTQPDKQNGRGKKIVFSDVKNYALGKGIDIYQPKRVREDEYVDILNKLKPDLIVVVAYGQILPKSIINIAEYGCINVHGSILPKYRGASPIQTARMNGECETGVSIMYIDEGLDTGDVILTSTLPILSDDTSATLFSKMSVLGAKTLIDAICMIESNTVKRVKQDDSKATHTKILTKELGLLNFKKSAITLHNLIMGLNPWPVAYTTFCGKKVKVFKSRVIKEVYDGEKIGVIVDCKNFIVSCGDNTFIEFLEVLAEGGKKMDGKSFIVGRNIDKNTIVLGE